MSLPIEGSVSESTACRTTVETTETGQVEFWPSVAMVGESERTCNKLDCSKELKLPAKFILQSSERLRGVIVSAGGATIAMHSARRVRGTATKDGAMMTMRKSGCGCFLAKKSLQSFMHRCNCFEVELLLGDMSSGREIRGGHLDEREE